MFDKCKTFMSLVLKYTHKNKTVFSQQGLTFLQETCRDFLYRNTYERPLVQIFMKLLSFIGHVNSIFVEIPTLTRYFAKHK